MNEKFKYYIYYDIEGNIQAYTNEKSISTLFDSQRNLKYYKKRKEFISRERVNQLAKDHYSKTLRVIDLNTINDLSVKIALTEKEQSFVYGETCRIMNSLYTILWNINPDIFKDKIIQAMNVLGINYICKELGTVESNNPKNCERIIKIDELQIFLNKFHKYMKGG